MLSLVSAQIPAGRIEFTPRLVRGLSYYTGPIWEVVADGVPGSIASGGRYDHLIEQLGGPDVPGTGGSLGIERILLLRPGGGPAGRAGRLDVAVTVLGRELEARSFQLAAAARQAGLRASVYLGSSGKLGRQLKWASDQGARWALIYGRSEERSRHGHRAGHGQRGAGRRPRRRSVRVPGPRRCPGVWLTAPARRPWPARQPVSGRRPRPCPPGRAARPSGASGPRRGPRRGGAPPGRPCPARPPAGRVRRTGWSPRRPGCRTGRSG